MRSPRTAALYTLGCKVNQYEGGALLAGLAARGVRECPFTEKADLYIINTCAVTRAAERKSLQLIRRARTLNPAAKVVLCGCMARRPGGLAPAETDFVFDAREPEGLYAWLCLSEAAARPAPPRRTRAYIKIQDGCDRFCAYCVVPYTRGPLSSRPLRDIIDEAVGLAAQGVREVVLTGIQTAAYGKDVVNGPSLPGLIQAVAALPGLARLRLGSIEPGAVDEAFLRAIENDAVCAHFHLSLQSGCDATLRRMNRRYSPAAYAQAARSLRAAKADAALTTDVIVGFPGETQADFDESVAFITRMGFARLHVFEFSPRPGTPAAVMPGAVPDAVKKERAALMRQAGETARQRFLSLYAGREMEVLFESRRGGLWEGHTGNYITVRAPQAAANTLARVRLTRIEKGYMAGEVLRQ